MRNIVIVEAHMHSVWFGSFLIALFMAFMGLKLKFSTTFVATTSTVPIHPGVTVIFPILGQGKGFCRKDAHCSQKHRERERERERDDRDRNAQVSGTTAAGRGIVDPLLPKNPPITEVKREVARFIQLLLDSFLLELQVLWKISRGRKTYRH
jgi:hypothetical protein